MKFHNLPYFRGQLVNDVEGWLLLQEHVETFSFSARRIARRLAQFVGVLSQVGTQFYYLMWNLTNYANNNHYHMVVVYPKFTVRKLPKVVCSSHFLGNQDFTIFSWSFFAIDYDRRKQILWSIESCNQKLTESLTDDHCFWYKIDI